MILAGDAAIEAIEAVARSGPYLTVQLYPAAKDRWESAQAMALATPAGAVVVDLLRTPKLAEFLSARSLLGAHDAKATAHSLQTSLDVRVQRWACATVTHALLAGSTSEATEPAVLAHHWGVAPVVQNVAGAHLLAAQAQHTACVLSVQMEALKRQGMVMASKIEAQAVRGMVTMERHGMPLDAARWRACTQAKATEAQAQAAQVSAQLRAILHVEAPDDEVLQALQRAGKPAQSLSTEGLVHLPEPLRRPLQAWMTLRRADKVTGDTYLRHLMPDGRVRPHFVQIGARTGRMACTRPNLQAMTADPARRACFRAPEGYAFVMADYATCELRVLADMSEDKALIAAFEHGTDIHSQVARRLFGVQVDRTTRQDLRQIAKTISFGLIYGMGTPSLARTLKMAPDRAQHIVDEFFSAYPRVRAYLHDESEAAVRRGYAISRSGRRCALDSSATDISAQLRLARNMPIQGTSADITKAALARLGPLLPPEASLILCVHDELILLCPHQAVEAAQHGLVQGMQQAGEGLLRQVALVADVRRMDHWGAH